MHPATTPDQTVPARPRATLWTILALWLLFYASFTLFTPPLLDDADSVHAEVAREMLLRHDWVTLYANGIRYLEKAPLLYWSMAASFHLFGANATAARLPLALAVLALACAAETFARRAFRSPRAGLYAALLLLSSFGIFIFSRITIPDVAVCLWLSLAMLCFWLLEQPALPTPYSPSPVPWAPSTVLWTRLLGYAFAACCALNVLTKGLIGVVFPLAIAGLYLLLVYGPRAGLNRVRQLHPVPCALVFLVIAAPWHLLAGLANPTQGHPGNLHLVSGHWTVPLPTDGNVHGWFWFYFVNEQLLRYLNLRVPRDYDTVPLVLFWALNLVWLMPFSAFLPQAIAATRSSWGHLIACKPLDSLERTRLLLLLWAAFVLTFFSFSTRQEYYVLPALPALALLVAGWLAAEADAAEGEHTAAAQANPTHAISRLQAPALPAGRRPAALLALAGTLAAAAALSFVLTSRAPAPNQDLASLLQQNPGDYALSFGHFLDLNRAAMGAFRLPLLLTAAALAIGTVSSWILRRRGRPHHANLALFAATFVFLVAAHLGLRTFSPVLTSQQLAAAIAPELRPAAPDPSRSPDLIVLNGEYEAGSTLGFYLRRPVHILNGRSSNLWYGSFFPDAPPIFETDATIARRWRGPQRIFLWQDLAALTHTGDGNPLPPLPGPIYVIAQSGGKEILSNQPNHSWLSFRSAAEESAVPPLPPTSTRKKQP
jgi:4-amino-4-deoxy-L-arabinose transferase-like glycosyltransferase